MHRPDKATADECVRLGKYLYGLVQLSIEATWYDAT